MLPQLNDVLQCLSTNGYSVFSLIDDVLSQGCNQEDPRIKLLREGVERDAADICARLLNHSPASASVSAWALGFAQAKMMTLPWNNNVVSPGLSSRVAWTSTSSPGRFMNMGKVLSKNYRYGVTIDVLPDNVVLDIFDFCLRNSTMPGLGVIQRTRKWQILVHVCQRWRRIAFASPRRLDLHLSCSYGTPVRRDLGSWPITLPLAIDYPSSLSRLTHHDKDSIIFALERTSRVHRIDIHVPGPLSRKAAAVMRRSFPVLTHLYLAWDLDQALEPSPEPGGVSSVIPSRFLGGSAPNLQHFHLRNVPFPHLPTFLLSARNLITLKVENICPNGYISPEAMVGGLAVLTRLMTLSITSDDDDEPPFPSDQIRPDPPMRITLPVLTAFHYRGYSKYLEDFSAQIDMPRVDDFRLEYLGHEIQATQLSRFLDRTENLKLDQFNCAKVTICYSYVQVELNPSRPQGEHDARLTLVMDGYGLDTHVLCVVRVLDQLSPTFSHVDHLEAHGDEVELSDTDDIVDWIPFFHLFPAAETLHLSGGVIAYIVSALEDLANSEEMVTDVFPAVHLIWLDDMDNNDFDEPVGSIERFLAMRQLTGFPVTVVNTEDEFSELLGERNEDME